ncbi:hypothetical protein BX070DRAFT_24487 [Coemansia spiralis]|nr:hypothetical protein BX070DRAFT_24487 [Coemansia spiralis]
MYHSFILALLHLVQGLRGSCCFKWCRHSGKRKVASKRFPGISLDKRYSRTYTLLGTRCLYVFFWQCILRKCCSACKRIAIFHSLCKRGTLLHSFCSIIWSFVCCNINLYKKASLSLSAFSWKHVLCYCSQQNGISISTQGLHGRMQAAGAAEKKEGAQENERTESGGNSAVAAGSYRQHQTAVKKWWGRQLRSVCLFSCIATDVQQQAK